MRIFFLGGTSFVGRHVAEAAIAAGHEITFFNRGMTDPSLFPAQRHVRGDRYGSLEALANVEADVVIDTSGYTPNAVRESALAVAGRIRRYVFVSTIDAYDFATLDIDESSPTKSLPTGAITSEPSAEHYGALKVLAERALVEVLGAERVLIVRAGLMVGPHDATDRFTYWPARIASGGRVLAPRAPTMPVQIIDVRDVAAWIVAEIAAQAGGTFNLVGDCDTIALGDVLAACRDAAYANGALTWVSDDFLIANDVGAWVEMPLWLPESPEMRGLLRVRNERAKAVGLRLRPLATTVRDVLEEFRSRPAGRTLRAGLSPKREATLLARWDALVS